MIKSPLLDKKSYCHALLTSNADYEVYIPIRGIIEDVILDEDIPCYKIRIVKFYDGINFLRRYFFKKSFPINSVKNVIKVAVPKHIKLTQELENWLSEESDYRFVVESLFVFKTRVEMLEMFNKLQDYLITRKMFEIKKITLRDPYVGNFKANSSLEFDNRIRRGFSDKFKSEEEMTKFLTYIETSITNSN